MIEIEDLSVRFGDVSVLDNVGLAVERGSFVALCGPNGAGKTTLLRALNGLLTPTGGTVRVDGQNVSQLTSREVSRYVATVPQETAVAFAFDVRDVVAMGRTPHRSRFEFADEEDRDAVERAMERAQVADLADRPIDAVSGGERQRVLLARALAQDAPVLLLDEPTANLDINHQVRTLDLVADLVAEGTTVVAAIHDLDLAARYADRVALLANGSVVASGPPENVLTGRRLESVFGTQTVVTSNPITGTPTVTALSGRTAGVDGGIGERVHVLGGGSVARELLTVLDNDGIDPSIGPIPQGDTSLETARLREIPAVVSPPFEQLDETTWAAVADHVQSATITVLTGPHLPQDDSDPLSSFDHGCIERSTIEDCRLIVLDPDGQRSDNVDGQRFDNSDENNYRVVESVPEALDEIKQTIDRSGRD